jgi:hypothetical protein
MAFESTVMSADQDHNAHPPRWAERLLRFVLSPANRDAITGDLLEEYREVIWPTRGPFLAQLWYLKHASSVAAMSNSFAQWAIWLLAAGTIAVAFRLRNQVAPPLPAGAWTAVAIIASAGLFARPADLKLLWASSVRFGLIFCTAAVLVSIAIARLVSFFDQHAAFAAYTVTLVSVVAASLAPFFDEHAVFDAYAVNGGRLIMLYSATVFIGTGFWGAWRGQRVVVGILAAVGTSIVGATAWLGLAGGLLRFFPELREGLGPIFTIGSPAHPLSNSLMLVMFSIAPGVVGATVARGLCHTLAGSRLLRNN